MIKIILCLLTVWSIPVVAYSQNNAAPAINGLHLGDSQNQMLFTLGAGEPMPMESGVFSVFYERDGLTFILSEQAGINRIEQIEVSRIIPGGFLGAQVGQSKSAIERSIGELNFADTDDANNGVLAGQGWIVHFIFDNKGILQRLVLSTENQTVNNNQQ